MALGTWYRVGEIGPSFPNKRHEYSVSQKNEVVNIPGRVRKYDYSPMLLCRGNVFLARSLIPRGFVPMILYATLGSAANDVRHVVVACSGNKVFAVDAGYEIMV